MFITILKIKKDYNKSHSLQRWFAILRLECYKQSKKKMTVRTRSLLGKESLRESIYIYTHTCLYMHVKFTSLKKSVKILVIKIKNIDLCLHFFLVKLNMPKLWPL